MSLLFALSLLAAAPAEDSFGNRIDCAKDQYQLALTVCAGREFRRADAEMNTQWPKALAAAEAIDRENVGQDSPRGHPAAKARDALLASQRAFLIYRDETCNVGYIAEFAGSIAPMDQQNCLTKITTHRTQQLRDLLG